MKRLLLLTLNIVMVTIAWAGDVIPQQASVNARGFMQQRGTMASTKYSLLTTMSGANGCIMVFSAFFGGDQLDTGV